MTQEHDITWLPLQTSQAIKNHCSSSTINAQLSESIEIQLTKETVNVILASVSLANHTGTPFAKGVAHHMMSYARTS